MNNPTQIQNESNLANNQNDVDNIDVNINNIINNEIIQESNTRNNFINRSRRIKTFNLSLIYSSSCSIIFYVILSFYEEYKNNNKNSIIKLDLNYPGLDTVKVNKETQYLCNKLISLDYKFLYLSIANMVLSFALMISYIIIKENNNCYPKFLFVKNIKSVITTFLQLYIFISVNYYYYSISDLDLCGYGIHTLNKLYLIIEYIILIFFVVVGLILTYFYIFYIGSYIRRNNSN